MCAVQYRTVQCSTLMYYTVQYSTQIPRIVLYSIVISIPNSLLGPRATMLAKSVGSIGKSLFIRISFLQARRDDIILETWLVTGQQSQAIY